MYLDLSEKEDIVVSEEDLVHPGAELLREPLVGLQPTSVEAQAQRGPNWQQQQQRQPMRMQRASYRRQRTKR